MVFFSFLGFFVENWLIFGELGCFFRLPLFARSNELYSISTAGQHEHHKITQARSDKKLVRTEGRNAVSDFGLFFSVLVQGHSSLSHWRFYLRTP